MKITTKLLLVGALLAPGLAQAQDALRGQQLAERWCANCHVVSRAALPIVMRQLVPARSDGLGASAGQPDDAAIAWCLGIGIIAALICFGLTRGIMALLVTAAAVALLAALARRQIGGYTGDVLGAAQQIGEITMLLTAAAA